MVEIYCSNELHLILLKGFIVAHSLTVPLLRDI